MNFKCFCFVGWVSRYFWLLFVIFDEKTSGVKWLEIWHAFNILFVSIFNWSVLVLLCLMIFLVWKLCYKYGWGLLVWHTLVWQILLIPKNVFFLYQKFTSYSHTFSDPITSLFPFTFNYFPLISPSMCCFCLFIFLLCFPFNPHLSIL